MSGSNGSSPSSLVNVGGTLYFAANDGFAGAELWKSDGSPSGTTLVRDIVSGAAGSSPIYLTNIHGQLFFRAISGYVVWTSDGTPEGTTDHCIVNAPVKE
jgi:ELWxxDGT repeat protein